MARPGAVMSVLVMLLVLQGKKVVLARWNATCMLVFGDSTVDPGNNNRLPTAAKANFLPYGKDFFGGRPTGRFCDGRLATDFIAEALGIAKSIPAFLDPDLTLEQLQHGVSFASASSGYDELTAMNADVISFSKQIEYLRHYKIHLKSLVGATAAEKILRDAIVVISASTNDFIANYYLSPDRPKQYTLPEYEDYLITLLSNYTKEITRVGPRKIVVVGAPPMGCLPVVKTLMNSEGCIDEYNDVAISFNSKLVAKLPVLAKNLGLTTGYLDIYQVMSETAKNPMKYGLEETSKGCVGSGTIETGALCKDQNTCNNPSTYMFWDAVHPTQRMYKIIADEAMNSVVGEVLG